MVLDSFLTQLTTGNGNQSYRFKQRKLYFLKSLISVFVNETLWKKLIVYKHRAEIEVNLLSKCPFIGLTEVVV